jgi:hypothetical protein
MGDSLRWSNIQGVGAIGRRLVVPYFVERLKALGMAGRVMTVTLRDA